MDLFLNDVMQNSCMFINRTFNILLVLLCIERFVSTSYLRFCQSLMQLFIMCKHEIITSVESIVTTQNERYFHNTTCLGIIPTCKKACPATQSVQTCTTKWYSIHNTKRQETWTGRWTEIMLQISVQNAWTSVESNELHDIYLLKLGKS
jgi:hypothetical protein